MDMVRGEQTRYINCKKMKIDILTVGASFAHPGENESSVNILTERAPGGVF